MKASFCNNPHSLRDLFRNKTNMGFPGKVLIIVFYLTRGTLTSEFSFASDEKS